MRNLKSAGKTSTYYLNHTGAFLFGTVQSQMRNGANLVVLSDDVQSFAFARKEDYRKPIVCSALGRRRLGDGALLPCWEECMSKFSAPPFSRLLADLNPLDFELFAEHLEPINLPLRFQLEQANIQSQYFYFPDHGIASMVANLPGGRDAEVSLIGHDGMTGLCILMGEPVAPLNVYMQIAGAGQRIKREVLLLAIDKSVRLQFSFLRYGFALFTLAARTALTNGHCTIEERLARWLLLAHDRQSGDALPLTHEFLSVMLAVRRPSVTVSLQHLQKQGIIRITRALITVLDRDGLIKLTNGAYGAPESDICRRFC